MSKNALFSYPQQKCDVNSGQIVGFSLLGTGVYALCFCYRDTAYEMVNFYGRSFDKVFLDTKSGPRFKIWRVLFSVEQV
jgi:hypothetical protein